MSISDAVGSEAKSAVTGYKTTKGFFGDTGSNLPMRVAVFGEANADNQSGLDTSGKQITSAKQAGDLYGYGSPMHMMFNIIYPPLGGGSFGSIPIYAFPQTEASGAAAKVITMTVTGDATANVTHYLKIAGRTSINANVYAVNIEKDDTSDEIAEKFEDAVNAMLASPMSASSPAESQANSNDVVLTAKWKGLTSDDLEVEVVTNGVSAGITYAFADTTAGSGTPSIATGLTALGEEWFTISINGYGLQSDIIEAFEAFVGKPADGDTAPTGRYASTVMKPMVVLTGSTSDDPSATTDAEARKTNVAIAVCPAPNSDGMPFEAAANMCVLLARQAQDNPHLDVTGKSYPDMPVPDGNSIGTMGTYANRQAIVLKGCSTVKLSAGAYEVVDLVTTYHPEGEVPVQYDFVRHLLIDWNVFYTYKLLEQLYVVNKTIANDNDVVTATNVIKASRWKGILYNMFDDLTKRALIAEPSFSEAGLQVGKSSTNPNRFETYFPYKRTGIAHIASTTAEAGFNTSN